MNEELRKQKEHLDPIIKSLWHKITGGVSDKKIGDSDGDILYIVNDHLVSYVVQRIPPYNSETKSYADRKAVGFIIVDNSNIPLEEGLYRIYNDWNQLAQSFEVGGRLPEPLIVVSSE